MLGSSLAVWGHWSSSGLSDADERLEAAREISSLVNPAMADLVMVRRYAKEGVGEHKYRVTLAHRLTSRLEAAMAAVQP
jgi:hypothetical protein